MFVFTKPEEELRCLSLVMKVIYVLHVAKDDMLLVGNARRNLLHTIGHLQQVGLTDRQIQTCMKHIFFYFFFTQSISKGSFSPPDTPGGL